MKIKLNFWQICNMNFGFFGLQYSFGLQQSNMSPIYSYLGADEGNLPYLWLAGPMTGLLVQPLIGAISDKTITKWGRRTPYFLIGAILCSICLFIMPYSSTVWMAASILWILDAANNITQEPYRAFVSDKLDDSQHAEGFLSQSAFTGLGQTLSYLTPTLLIMLGISKMSKAENGIPTTTLIAFVIGAVVSISSILWTLYTTKEIPLTEEEILAIRKEKLGTVSVLKDIKDAIVEMPQTMKLMLPMMFFSWYAMFIYWQFIAKSLSKSLYGITDSASEAFRNAEILSGQIGAFYNFISFISAFLIIYLAKKMGAKLIHTLCLIISGIGLIVLVNIKTESLVFIPMIGMGLSWASMMGNTYVMLAGCLPKERTGVYMGIFNMFIVIPMLIETFTFPTIYKTVLGENPVNALILAGIMLILAGVSTQFIKLKNNSEIES